MQENFTYTLGRWGRDEVKRFNDAIASGNKCWAEVSEIVGTRTKAQCRSHYQKLKISERIREIKKRNNKKNENQIKIYRFRDIETQCIEEINILQIPNKQDSVNSPVITPKTKDNSSIDEEFKGFDEADLFIYESNVDEFDFLRF